MPREETTTFLSSLRKRLSLPGWPAALQPEYIWHLRKLDAEQLSGSSPFESTDDIKLMRGRQDWNRS